MGGVKGDFVKLRELIDRFKAIGTGQVVEMRVSQELAATGLKLVQDGFRKEQNPYGDPWAPLKRRKGRILRDTGRMAASVNAVPLGRGFRLQISTGYARYHQEGAVYSARSERAKRTLWRGTKSNRFQKQKKGGQLATVHRYRYSTKGHKLVPRLMLPITARGLGPIWGAAFARTARRVVRDLLKGAA